MAAALAILFIVVLAMRLALAARYATPPPPLRGAPYTIVQPILSGDPRLESTLAANLRCHPESQFLWMTDDDDAGARQICARLVPKNPNIRIVEGPGPADGENPKLAKLIRALPLVRTPRLIVVDDDTILPAAALFPNTPIATGMPVFTAKDTWYERFTGGFVNGSGLLTYLPAARLGLQRTINGMVYSVDVDQLRRLGGFAAAGHELTDDYAVARLYLRNGLPLTQIAAPAFVSVTIRSFGHYASVMRRWMIFASRYFRDNRSFATLFWIVLPSLLPLAGLGFALAEGHALAWILLLFGKAAANRILLRAKLGVGSTPADLVFEVAADLLTPLWAATALLQPNRMKWRSRRIQVHGKAIRYR